jgi:hypothetical protein
VAQRAGQLARPFVVPQAAPRPAKAAALSSASSRTGSIIDYFFGKKRSISQAPWGFELASLCCWQPCQRTQVQAAAISWRYMGC